MTGRLPCSCGVSGSQEAAGKYSTWILTPSLTALGPPQKSPSLQPCPILVFHCGLLINPAGNLLSLPGKSNAVCTPFRLDLILTSSTPKELANILCVFLIIFNALTHAWLFRSSTDLIEDSCLQTRIPVSANPVMNWKSCNKSLKGLRLQILQFLDP